MGRAACFRRAFQHAASLRLVGAPPIAGKTRAPTGRIPFVEDQRGATAVEFALIASMLIFTVLFVMAIGFLVFLNQTLDFATYKASRQIMIGAVQKAGTAQSNFPATYVCPYLPAALACANVIVNIQSITEAAQPNGYYALVNSSQTALIMPPLNNASTQYSLGSQGTYEYLQVVYPITFLPGFITSLMSNGATYNGTPAIVITSTAAFRNEQY